MKSSPVTAAAAAAAAAGVEVVSAPNREGSWDRLKQSQREAKHTRLKASRRRILSKNNAWNYMNGYVREYLRFWGRDFANCSDSVSLFKPIFEAVPYNFGTYAACCSVPYFHTPLSIILFSRFFCSFFFRVVFRIDISDETQTGRLIDAFGGGFADGRRYFVF